MDEDRGTGAAPPEEEEMVRRLLEGVGPRPPIPREHLDAIAAAARSAWREKVGSGREARARRPFPVRTVPAAMAAVAAVLVALAGLAWWLARDREAMPAVARLEAARSPIVVKIAGSAPRRLVPGDEVPRGAALRTGGGGASLRLEDGATLRLAAATRLRLPAATVLELDRGAVYADTGTGGAALEVRTRVGTARDVGTRFAVALLGEGLRVRVRDGAVDVERQGRTYRAAARQELLLRRDGTLARREIAGHGPEWEWVARAAPPFAIEGRTLRELLDWAARENGWRIRYADESLAAAAGEIVLHGSVGELGPGQAPFAVLPGAGLEGELRQGTLTVRRVKTPR